jgi:formiminotetrahydrofolate cyclodeaminase
MTMLKELIAEAYEQIDKVYEEAITASQKIATALDNVAVPDAELYLRIGRIRDAYVQTINAAWHAKYATEKLLEEQL